MQFKGVKECLKCLRSAVFGMRMPSSCLHQSCDSLACFSFSFVLGSVSHFLPLPPPPSPQACQFFSPLMLFSVTGACSFPFVWGLMAGLRCCASQGGIISIQELAANSGSPWILQASNLHFSDAVVKWKKKTPILNTVLQHTNGHLSTTVTSLQQPVFLADSPYIDSCLTLSTTANFYCPKVAIEERNKKMYIFLKITRKSL